MDRTPVSLLERLRRPNDQAAWERFVQLYTPLLCHWARKLEPDEVVRRDAAKVYAETAFLQQLLGRGPDGHHPGGGW
jgi:hypothetical protein